MSHFAKQNAENLMFLLHQVSSIYSSRSSEQRCSVKKGVLGNFAKFTGKQLRQRKHLLFYRTSPDDCFCRSNQMNGTHMSKCMMLKLFLSVSENILIFYEFFEFFWTNSCNKKCCRQHINCKKLFVLLLLLMRNSKATCICGVVIHLSFCSNQTVDSPWTQEVNWTYIRRSEDVLDALWTFYVRSIYVLCPGGSTWLYFWLKEEQW